MEFHLLTPKHEAGASITNCVFDPLVLLRRVIVSVDLKQTSRLQTKLEVANKFFIDPPGKLDYNFKAIYAWSHIDTAETLR